MKTKRYKITAIADNRAVLTDTATGIRREFWAPSDGGYVREISESRPGTLGMQVCDGLVHRGSTLTCGPTGLLALIRREARRCYRDPDYVDGLQYRAEWGE
jgi:hypothetical protein